MLDTLLQQVPGVWRAASLAQPGGERRSSGIAQLDAALGGGWPACGLIEVFCEQYGIGELRMLLPVLSQVTALPAQAPQTQVALWLNPPYAVQAAALMQHGLNPAQHLTSQTLSPRDTLWAMEQALASGACGMVIAWSSHIDMTCSRRLKLAAVAGACMGVLFRPLHEAPLPSAAQVRVKLQAVPDKLHIELLKVPGRLPSMVTINMSAGIAP